MELAFGIVVDIVVCIIFTISLRNYIDFNKFFKCKNCGHIYEQLRSNIKCDKCYKNSKITEDKVWDHFILRRTTIIRKKSGGMTYNYKELLKNFKLELIISSIAWVILTIFIVISVVSR